MLIELKDAIKSEVLFRSEDGVDIFEGDKTCWINDWTVTNFTDWKRKSNTKELHFSTKEAAEEYINSRKPYLSNKDVLDEIEKCTNIQQLKKVFTNKVAY